MANLRTRLLALALFAGLNLSPSAAPAQAPSSPPSRPLAWTDWADLALSAPVVIAATATDVDRLSKRETADLSAGQGRVLVRAALTAALKAPGVLPAEAAWHWEGAVDRRGRPPFAKKDPVIVFGQPLTGGGNPAVQPLRLVARHAQQPWTADSEALVRDVLKQALAPGAAGLMVTGLRDGFHSKGDIPGTSESQFFLATEGGSPLALVVRRAADSAAQVLVASGEIVDRAAAVRPRTLLWRGMACGMPAMLPEALAADAELVTDYAFARAEIGACGRTVDPAG